MWKQVCQRKPAQLPQLQSTHRGLVYGRQDFGFSQWLVWNTEDHTVLVCKLEFSNAETCPVRGLLKLGRIRRLQTKGFVLSH